MSFAEESLSGSNNVNSTSDELNSTVNAFTSPGFFEEGTPVWITMDTRNDSFATFLRYVDNPIPRSCRLCWVRRANGCDKNLPAILVHCVIGRTRSRSIHRPLTRGTIVDAISRRNWNQVVRLVRHSAATNEEERLALRWQDSQQCHSVLHLAMKLLRDDTPNNTAVIEALIDLVPGAVWRPKRCGRVCIGSHPKGATPLHIYIRQHKSQRRGSRKIPNNLKALFLQRQVWTIELLAKILQSSNIPCDVVKMIADFMPQAFRDYRDAKGKSCFELN